MVQIILSQWKNGVGEVHALLAVTLFFITNSIGKHSFSRGYVTIDLFVKDDDNPAFNYIIRVFTPVVYLIITSAILYYLGYDKIVKEFYMVSFYYILFRFVVNALQERLLLINWGKQIFYYVSILFFSWVLYVKIISIKANVLPDPSNIVNEMWIIIIVFLYKLVDELNISPTSFEKRRDNYLQVRYAEFKRLYGSIIDKELANDVLKAVAYAIIIHENYNRSTIVRLVENISFFITKQPHSLGVMQFPTSRFINDRQSVVLGTRKILRSYRKAVSEFVLEEKPYPSYEPDNSTFYSPVITKYNGGNAYQQVVRQLTETILSKYYPDTKDTLVPPSFANKDQEITTTPEQ